MKIVSDKICRQNQKNTFCAQCLFFENRAVYEKTSKNITEPDRPQMTIWHILIACWVPKATNTQVQAV